MLVLAEQVRKQRIDRVAFSPTGDALAAAGNGSWLTVWKLDTPNEPRRFLQTDDPHAQVFDFVFWDSGNALVAACGCRGLHIQSLKPGEHAAVTHSSAGYLQRIAIHPSERQVIGVNHRPVQFIRNAGIVPGHQSWTSDDKRALCESWRYEHRGFLTYFELAFLPDPARFVITRPRAGGCMFDVFDSATGVHRETLPDACPYGSVAQLATSPTGEWLVAISERALVVRPARDLLQPQRLILNDNKKHFTGIAFHPSGKYLAATSNDATVKLYDTTTWEVERTFTWDIGKMRSIAFSPDGALAAAGSDKGKVVVWDVDL